MGVVSRIDQSDRARFVVVNVSTLLSGNDPAGALGAPRGSTRARYSRVSGLNEEVLNDAVKRQSLVERGRLFGPAVGIGPCLLYTSDAADE